VEGLKLQTLSSSPSTAKKIKKIKRQKDPTTCYWKEAHFTGKYTYWKWKNGKSYAKQMYSESKHF
jgi:hypothetical protein